MKVDKPGRVVCEISVSLIEATGCQRRSLGDLEILAVHTPEGIKVYSGVCPHLGGPLLDGDCSGGRIRCPWHLYEFDLASGRRVGPAGGPNGLALRPLPFEVERGVLRVLRP